MLKPYSIAVIGIAMVEIECPHCDEGIELDDGASGLFDCPHCDEEFTWKDEANEEESNEHWFDRWFGFWFWFWGIITLLTMAPLIGLE